MDCLFCKSATGEIPSTKIFETDDVLAFADIYPKAPFHAVIIPKKHIKCADNITAENSDIIAKIFEAIALISKQEGLTDGYRIVNNCGDDGGQTVGHLHFHMLAKRSMKWPPG